MSTYDESMIQRIAKEVNQRFPLGTFDDDPGGPWMRAGVRCHCAAGSPRRCPGTECPHHLHNRPGWRK